MKTFGKVMLTILYILCAGFEVYCARQYFIEADNLWTEQ